MRLCARGYCTCRGVNFRPKVLDSAGFHAYVPCVLIAIASPYACSIPIHSAASALGHSFSLLLSHSRSIAKSPVFRQTFHHSPAPRAELLGHAYGSTSSARARDHHALKRPRGPVPQTMTARVLGKQVDHVHSSKPPRIRCSRTEPYLRHVEPRSTVDHEFVRAHCN